MHKKPLFWAVLIVFILGGYASYSRHSLRAYQQLRMAHPMNAYGRSEDPAADASAATKPPPVVRKQASAMQQPSTANAQHAALAATSDDSQQLDVPLRTPSPPAATQTN